MSLVSGRLELDYCFFASNSSPSKPRFAEIVAALVEEYPKCLISYGDVQQLFIPVTEEQYNKQKDLGRVVSNDEGRLSCLVKKMVVILAMEHSNKGSMEFYALLLKELREGVEKYHSEGLTTIRTIITNFVSEKIAE